ncbi:restriction endonuclease subunit S [Vibrio parahaemolyticus]|nr:restriction endonuclease subunit S [Vibrio parahaemolyticus]EMA9068175.1 restriction endonuclease subunit S [Vibrio parahaemolyticus]
MGKYQAYPEYKDSGIDWLETIPEHWLTSKLRYTFSFGKGLTITKENLRDTGVPCVSYGEVHSKYGFEIDPARHPLKCVGDEYLKTSPYALLKKGDIVFADTSEDIDGSGNFTQLVSNEQVFAGYHTIIARPYNRECSRFYAYLLDSKELRTQIRHAVKGVKVFSITQAILRGVNIWLPPLEERAQIANFLDHETAKIDTLIEKQQQLIKLLKEKRQAVISHAVTKGLNPQAPMKDSGVEWLGEVPEHWDVCKLSYRYEVLLGKMLDEKKISGNYLGKYLRNTDVQWDSINTDNLPEMDFRPQERERYSVKKGDLIVCEGGEIGRCGIWESESTCFYQKALHRLRPLYNTDLTRFMFYVLFDAVHQERFISGAGKATIAHLPAETFKQYRFAFPPRDEQQSIIDFLDSIKGKFDLIENKAQLQIELLKERRTALISAAVTGKIDVRNWQAPIFQNQALEQTA